MQPPKTIGSTPPPPPPIQADEVTRLGRGWVGGQARRGDWGWPTWGEWSDRLGEGVRGGGGGGGGVLVQAGVSSCISALALGLREWGEWH